MATVSANRHRSVVELDRTMRDESMLDSGEESDVMDNIVFKRPVTRRMSKAKASTPVASTSTSPVRRRSPRKSSSSSTASLPRPRYSRRSSQTTMSSSQSSSSQPQSQSQSQSQSEPQEITDEPTGMSQELALVSVASEEPTINERMEDAEPRSEDSAPAPMDIQVSPKRAETVSVPVATDTNEPSVPASDSLDNADTGPTGTVRSATVPVFDTEPERATGPETTSQPREPKPSSRTPLALPVFTVTEEAPSQVSNVSEAPVPVFPDSFDDSTCSSIGNMSVTFDLSIPTSTSSASTSLSSIPLLEPPRTQNTPRRSPRLSGISASSTVSSDSASLTVKTRASSKLITSTSPQRRAKVKAPLLDQTEDGPSDTSHASSLFDSTIFTTSKGKEKERVSPSPSPPPLPSATKSDIHAPFKPPKLRSLSPESDAVLMSLQQSLLPPPLKALAKSSERPPPLPSAMKRRAVEEAEPTVGSPSKRARFDADPDPPPVPPPSMTLPAHSRPARIRVHPANSGTKPPQGTGSFTGSYPPIVVRPAGPSSPMRQARPPSSSPSRQQLLLQRPAGPPMRVPIGQQQRAVFPARVVSPVRTGSHGSLNGISAKASPVKRKEGIWGSFGTSGNPSSGKIKPTPGLIKPSEVLIAPEHTATESSSPVRAARTSRLPVPARGKAQEKLGLINEHEKPPVDDMYDSMGVPAVGTGSSAENGKLQVPSTSTREPTPPTPLETPASPGSSSSTLIMDVPLFYQPPAPRLPPIQHKTAEEIIAEGTAREAQRKRENKTAAAAAAALRCLPLTRAPRRIIPDGSALQSWASLAPTSSMTESQKELQRITATNTERNNTYGCVIERIESFVDIPRPPSPTSRVRTKAQKARETERQSRDERAQRRSAARDGDTSTTSEPSRSTLAPGDESEWTEPERRGRHVRWAQALAREDVGPRELGAGSAASVGRGCLARTYELDRHGNARGQTAEVEARRVVVVRYVYNDEPGFKAWKRGQTG